MRPLTGKSRQAIFVLGQFDLQRSFARIGVLREDVQDERRTVNDLDVIAKGFFQFSLMARRKLIVENDHIGLERSDFLTYLLGFAGANIRSRVDLVQMLNRASNHLDSGSIR